MSSERKFFRELEGIRGYAFLVVFFTHYTYPLMRANHLWTYPFRILVDLAWIAVPVFLVLSGFLITGVLLKTRSREGYFRTFYARRSVRVFPLYFLIVLSLGIFGLVSRQDMRGYWTNLVYLQNIWPSSIDLMRSFRFHGCQIEISHFWSLALEEQFYLVWPLVIWMCRTRRQLLITCLALVVAGTIFRFLSPLFGYTPVHAYFSTFTRGGAVVLGALLALWRDHPSYARFEKLALPGTLLGLGTLLLVRMVTGATNPFLGDHTMWRVIYMIPLVNLTAMGIVIETMRDHSMLQRMCRKNLICKLGSLSYACYAFHLLYCAYFQEIIFPRLQLHMPHRLAIAVLLFGALGLTVALATISHFVLEAPAMRLKDRLVYGPERAAQGALLPQVQLKLHLPRFPRVFPSALQELHGGRERRPAA